MNVYLRAFEIPDHVQINQWRNDDENYRHTLGNKHFVSSEREKKSVESKIADNFNSIHLAICATASHALVGTLSIVDIDWRNRKACWGGIIIGNPEDRKKGYAYEASLLMLQFIFDELGMNRFYGYWKEDYALSINMGRKLGFKTEGVLRDYAYKNGKFHNAVIMAILRNDYYSLRVPAESCER